MKFLVSWFYFNSSCFSVMLLLNYKTIKKHSGGSPTICLLFVFAILSNGSGRYLKIRLKYFSSQTPGSLSFNPMIKKTNQQKDQLSLSLYLEALQPGSIINTLVCSMLYPFFTQLSLNQIQNVPISNLISLVHFLFLQKDLISTKTHTQMSSTLWR